MAIRTWPTDIRIGWADYAVEFDVQFNVFRNGSIVTYGLPGGRWTAVIGFEPEVESMQRPKIEALIMSLEGGANRLRMHHHARPIPNGTMRGTPTAQFAATTGAKQVQMTGVNGTLNRGDIIGILGQMIYITTDATPSGGNMTVDISPPLRNALTPGTAVTWNKPTADFIPKSSTAGPFPYRQAQVRPGFSIELIEAY